MNNFLPFIVMGSQFELFFRTRVNIFNTDFISVTPALWCHSLLVNYKQRREFIGHNAWYTQRNASFILSKWWYTFIPKAWTESGRSTDALFAWDNHNHDDPYKEKSELLFGQRPSYFSECTSHRWIIAIECAIVHNTRTLRWTNKLESLSNVR
jgi:hypothetical protein